MRGRTKSSVRRDHAAGAKQLLGIFGTLARDALRLIAVAGRKCTKPSPDISSAYTGRVLGTDIVPKSDRPSFESLGR